MLSLCPVDVCELSSAKKAEKAMLDYTTFVSLRRKKGSLISLGPPTISFEGFAHFVAEVRNKKIYVYASHQLLAM